jgi:hypothetical protein
MMTTKKSTNHRSANTLAQLALLLCALVLLCVLSVAGCRHAAVSRGTIWIRLLSTSPVELDGGRIA